MSNQPHPTLSPLRIWVMRVPFILTGLLFSITAWSTLISYWGTFEPTEGVTYAFWGAISALSLIGIRYPLEMLPLLLLQFFYKLIWILAVGMPLMSQGTLSESGQELLMANGVGVVIDLIAIPWIYVARTYLLNIFRFEKTA